MIVRFLSNFITYYINSTVIVYIFLNLRVLLVDLNKEFYGYKNDIFFTKFLKRTGSTCKVNTKSASISPPDLSFQIYYSSMHQGRRKGGRRGGARPPCPFSRGAGAKVPFYKVYFINVYMWTEPYHLSILNHLLSTICSEVVTTACRFLISAL